MKPTTGRILLYKLSQADINAIEAKRAGIGWVGNPLCAGEVVPMIAVRIFEDEFGAGIPGVNGKLMLDGEDSFWATSRREGSEPGTWSWPPRA